MLFALMLTNKILVSSGKVKGSDVDVLLKGGGALNIASVSCTALHYTTDAAGASHAFHLLLLLHVTPLENQKQLQLFNIVCHRFTAWEDVD